MTRAHTAVDLTEFGINRVVEPAGALPQAADRLDPFAPLVDGELAVSVDRLNLDAASFQQIRSACGGDIRKMREMVLDIVGQRGKMQNPVTGSGGMLIGTVRETTPSASAELPVGATIATLVSLTATPLIIDDALELWNGDGEVVPTRGTAILSKRSIATVLPSDIEESVALSIFDVCGAPALTQRILNRPAIDGELPRRLLIIGGGKSGCLTAAMAREQHVWTQIMVPSESEAADLRTRNVADEVIVADARNPALVLEKLFEVGPLPDVTIVCVNVPGCEHSAILATRDHGAVIFFSMATQLAAAALGAESFARDLDLYIGSGYVPGHADSAIALLRRHENIRDFFISRNA